jgi:hypothetical protein
LSEPERPAARVSRCSRRSLRFLHGGLAIRIGFSKASLNEFEVPHRQHGGSRARTALFL